MTRLAFMAGLLAGAGLAVAQALPTQDGRALDANYMVGSGGYNSARGGQTIDGNLYVTGQIGGGFYYFHGEQPYSGRDQIGARALTGTENFMRYSIGMDQIRSGQLYGPTPYYAPNTVLGAAGIAAGLAMPGSSQPRSAYAAPAASPNANIQAYRPISMDMSRNFQLDFQLDMRLQPLPGRDSPNNLEGPYLQQLHQQEQQREAQDALATQLLQDRRLDERMSATQPAQPGQPLPPSAKLPAPGQDAFVDLLVTLHKALTQKEDEPLPPPAAARPAAPVDEAQQDEARLQQRVAESIQGQVVLHGLSGQGGDAFNGHMAQGEKLLREQKFDDALTQFRVAGTLDRDNPLAWLGQGVALLAQGHVLQANLALRQAMLRFPPLMQTRVDLPRMLGKEALATALALVKQRLEGDAGEDRPRLLFVAAFAAHGARQDDLARQHAKALLEAAGDDRLYKAYAQELLKAAK